MTDLRGPPDHLVPESVPETADSFGEVVAFKGFAEPELPSARLQVRDSDSDQPHRPVAMFGPGALEKDGRGLVDLVG